MGGYDKLCMLTAECLYAGRERLVLEAVDAAGEGADEALEFEQDEVGRDVRIRDFGLHDQQVDMHAFFGFLQFGKQCLLMICQVIH